MCRAALLWRAGARRKTQGRARKRRARGPTCAPSGAAGQPPPCVHGSIRPEPPGNQGEPGDLAWQSSRHEHGPHRTRAEAGGKHQQRLVLVGLFFLRLFGGLLAAFFFLLLASAADARSAANITVAAAPAPSPRAPSSERRVTRRSETIRNTFGWQGEVVARKRLGLKASAFAARYQQRLAFVVVGEKHRRSDGVKQPRQRQRHVHTFDTGKRRPWRYQHHGLPPGKRGISRCTANGTFFAPAASASDLEWIEIGVAVEMIDAFGALQVANGSVGGRRKGHLH